MDLTYKILNALLKHFFFSTLATKLPFGVSKSAMIPSSKGVMLIGGWNYDDNDGSDKILEYSILEKNWTILNTNLTYKRQYPLAFLATLNKTSCCKYTSTF